METNCTLCFWFRGYQRPGNPVPGDCGYHLHAHRSVFPHPITNEVGFRSAIYHPAMAYAF